MRPAGILGCQVFGRMGIQLRQRGDVAVDVDGLVEVGIQKAHVGEQSSPHFRKDGLEPYRELRLSGAVPIDTAIGEHHLIGERRVLVSAEDSS
jgi:hypothetical protein